MVRVCNGRDGTLTVFVDPKTGERLEHERVGEIPKACDCGLVFDDAKRSTIWPHVVITRGAS